ncbi:MAG: tetratricopeptide repeat protein [SAR202 cluster bacterium]|nr:tetratricopeptide repeat protein [SAR202 cluster bacterium]
MAQARNKPRKLWLNGAVIAGIVIALVNLSAGVWDELAAYELKTFLGNWYRPWMPWIVFLVSAAASVLGLIIAARQGRGGPQSDNPLISVVQDKPTNSPVAVNTTATGTIAAGNMVASGDVVVGNVTNIHNTVQAPPGPSATPSPLHQLPAVPADFTGREAELSQLRGQVGEKGVAISGLRGMGGIGKAALALKLAHETAPGYPDAQIFVDLLGTTSPLPPAQVMEHVIRAWHPEARLPEDPAQLRGLYNTVLADKKALLLLDNARDAAQVQPLIPPAGCLLLVTSRQNFHLSGLDFLELRRMDPVEARRLLLRIAGRLTDSEADAIAQRCGYLPLALTLAGGALKTRRGLSPQEYLDRLADAQRRLKELEPVRASFSLSYDLLTQEQQARWRALAVFPGSFEVVAAAAVWELAQAPAQDTLDQLDGYSLLEYDQASGRYRLHDLARDYARYCLADPERAAAQLRHARHYHNLLAAADQLYLQGGHGVTQGLGRFDLERANIEAGQAWAAAHSKEVKEATELCKGYPGVASDILSLRLHPQTYISWMETALASARELKHRQAEGVHLGNLGNAYADLGQPQRAIEHHEQALVISREIGDRRGEGQDLWNLAVVLDGLGRRREAIARARESLQALAESQSPDADMVRRRLAEWGGG